VENVQFGPDVAAASRKDQSRPAILFDDNVTRAISRTIPSGVKVADPEVN
jgi:hypothetical protein